MDKGGAKVERGYPGPTRGTTENSLRLAEHMLVMLLNAHKQTTLYTVIMTAAKFTSLTSNNSYEMTLAVVIMYNNNNNNHDDNKNDNSISNGDKAKYGRNTIKLRGNK